MIQNLARILLMGLLLLSSTQAASDVCDNTTIREYLNTQPLIRIGMSSSDGLGHQSLAATVVRRLRDVEYAGRLEVIYDDGRFDQLRPKLATLFPGFDPSGPDDQDVIPGKLSFHRRESMHNDLKAYPFVDLAIMGADDSERTPLEYRARYLLILQPFAWPRPASMQFQNQHGLTGEYLRELRNIPFALPPPGTITSLADVTDRAPALKPKLRPLDQVLEQRAKVDLGAYYGHGMYFDVGELWAYLRAIAGAADAAPSLFGRPVVVPVFITVRQDEMAELRLRMDQSSQPRRYQILDAHVSDLSDVFARVSAPQILVLPVPGVPPPAFNYFFSEADVPPVTGGLNSMCLMGQVGRPYLSSSPREPLHFKEIVNRPTASTDQVQIDLIYRANLNLQRSAGKRDADVGAIVEFMLAARARDSGMAQFFTSHRLMVTADDDRLIRGLRRLIAWTAQPKKFEAQTFDCVDSLTSELTPEVAAYRATAERNLEILKASARRERAQR